MDREFAIIIIVAVSILAVMFATNFLEHAHNLHLQFLADGGEIDFDTVGCNDETTKTIIANNNDYTSAQVMLAAQSVAELEDGPLGGSLGNRRIPPLHTDTHKGENYVQ